MPVTIDRCVDAVGLVLEERWTTAGGERVLTKRAMELELGDDVPDVDVPDAAPLADEQGNGAVRQGRRRRAPAVPGGVRPRRPGRLHLRRAATPWCPPGFGTGAPARIPADAGVALYTDVWRRGPDLLLLDQGATRAGPPRSTRTSASATVDLGAARRRPSWPSTCASREVRLTRPDGGFVRLSGTIPLDELVALAGSLHVLEEAR